MSQASYHAERIAPREWVYAGHRQPLRLCRHTSQAQVVTRNGRLLNAAADFNWGYGGTGPGNLAREILLDYTGNPDFADRWAVEFKEDIIAGLPDRWQFTGADIDRWLRAQGVRTEDYPAVPMLGVA